MDKKQRNILVWVLIWAGLLVAVLYSPVGSPELYAPVNYYSGGGAMYNNIQISNVSGIRSNADNTSTGFTVQSYSLDMNSRGFSGASGNTFTTVHNTGSVSWSGNSTATQTKSTGSGGGSMVGLSSVKRSQSSTNNTFAQNTGVVSMTSDMNMSEDFSTTRQGAGADGGGATDPGDEPTGPPIPIGDGWFFLLILISVYSVWKKNTFWK